MAVTLDRIVSRYLELRDDVKAKMEARHKKELEPVVKEMKLLESAMQHLLDAQNQKSASFTGIGTCYKQKWTKASIEDWSCTLEWIVENKRWDLLTKAVNKTVVMDEMTKVNPETGETTLIPCPIPGVSVDSGWKVNVRRS